MLYYFLHQIVGCEWILHQNSDYEWILHKKNDYDQNTMEILVTAEILVQAEEGLLQETLG